MRKIDFSDIAVRYEDFSLVQRSAGDLLLNLLDIGSNEDVLDLGCGAGNLTRKIREITKGSILPDYPLQMRKNRVITHTILGILHVFVHLMPYNALFSVHLLLAQHQFIWPSPLISQHNVD